MSINKTTIPEAEADPGGAALSVQLYAKDDGGTTQLFAQDSNDVVYQLTPPSTGSTDVSAANVLTFRPSSGLTGPIVFDDFDDLYNALVALRGANFDSGKYKIIFDDQDVGGPGNAVIAQSPPGNFTYDFSYVELVGVHQDQNVLAHFADNFGEGDSLVINNALWFEGLTVRSTGQDTAFIAQSNQTITLKRTTFNGQGQYVYDFLGVTGCVVHMDDESRMQRTTGAAMRVNTNALTVHVTGNNCVIDNLGIAGFVGGSVIIDIFSSSAQVDPQQDILLQTFNMRTASGFWPADPNGDLVAERGVLVSNENTGDVWRNTDGATAWSLFGTGGGDQAVVFDDFVPADKVNIRSDRATNQSPIDNTKVGITNLGSDDGGGGVGTTADYSTIGGGLNNEASGIASTVSGGEYNIASGYGSYAEGESNTSTGDYSHTEGFINTALGESAHAEGEFNDANGDWSHAEGAGSLASGTGAHAEGNAEASGEYSHAEGGGEASGDYSHAEGVFTTASGLHSHAEGDGTTADAQDSHAEGDGSYIDTGADMAHAEGQGTYVGIDALAAHAEGGSTQALAQYAHAEGVNTTAGVSENVGEAAHAEGEQTEALGAASHTEGIATQSDGDYAHAEGQNSNAIGIAAHAEGYFTVANGDYSHACGANSYARRESQWSHASGGVTGDGVSTHLLVLRGTTPGAGVGESVELQFGTVLTQLTLTDNHAYAFKVTAVIGANQTGPVRVSRTIEIKFNARRAAGVTIITATGVGDAYGDAATATWTLVATVGVAPDRIVLTFNTGAGLASASTIIARVEFTEVLWV